MLEEGKSMRCPPLRRKNQQRQSVINWPQPPFPMPLQRSGVGGREIRSEVESGNREEVGKQILGQKENIMVVSLAIEKEELDQDTT